MIIALIALTAGAAEPVAPLDDGASVRELVWVQPMTLSTPEPHTMQAGAPLASEGLLLELRVDPTLMVPSQRYEPTVYVGPVPARKFNWDIVDGCAVVWVPGTPDLTQLPIYIGSLELPERVDAERGSQELVAALGVGVTPFAAEQVASVTQPTTAVPDFRDVASLARARVDACSGSDNDRQRGPRPDVETR